MNEEQIMEDDTAAQEQRLVHLDLKGAPPKLSYYEWLFPRLRQWGATGLLVEYEDTFPYSGELNDLAASHAYTAEEVERLQVIARQNSLEVVPLIQTFGHFEFVLKHDRFRGLREVEQSPMTLCPSNPEAFGVVTRMIDQMLRLHPHSAALHIGADEVFHIGLCPLCAARGRAGEAGEGANASLVGGEDHRLNIFLSHVRRVVEYIRSTYAPPPFSTAPPPFATEPISSPPPSGGSAPPPSGSAPPTLRIIMWDDMLRHADPSTLKKSGIGDLVEPMVWYYHSNLDSLPDVWPLYAGVFRALWAASAFKGATGPCALTTDVGFHVENNKAWLDLVQRRVKPLVGAFRGYALTGWQRYDHYAALCDLLPVGLPSLAVCLLTLSSGAFTLDVHVTASRDLGFTALLPLNPLSRLGEQEKGVFPGAIIYRGAAELSAVKADFRLLANSDRVKGWMSAWHLKNNYTNPVHISNFLPELSQVLQFLESLAVTLRAALIELFPLDSADEWLTTHLTPDLDELRNLVANATAQLAIGGRARGGGASGQQSANHATV